MTLDDLLATLDDGSDAGENLEYDPAFTALELAAQPGEERQMGDEIQEAEEPDYKDMREKAFDVLSRSKDMRAAVHLSMAVLRIEGFPAFAKVTTYIRRCLEEHWDTCHPELDEDDDNDPTMRVNAVLGLADTRGVVRAIRLAPLTQSRIFGARTLLDIEIATGEIPAPETMEDPPSESAIDAAFQDTDDEALTEILAGASTAHDDLVAIDTVFTEQTPGQGPSLDPTIRALKKVRDRLVAATGGDAEEADGADAAGDEAGADTAGTGGGGGRRITGDITSQADVLTAIDKIMAYYTKYEPSSPVPLLLKRAKRLVGAGFVDIIKDMAPAGYENVDLIGGIAAEEAEEEEY
ncbi:MAG: type VI secretion system protein TssA [Pseudomonadota bacterium]